MRQLLLQRSCLVALAFAALPAAAQVQSVTTSLQRPSTPAQVIGSQYRSAIDQALQATSRGDLARAVELLQPVAVFCDGLLAKGTKLVSVADDAEYQAFVAESGDGAPVDWVDMACPEAYHALGFIAVERHDAGTAFAVLDKAMRLAPYWVDPLTERGGLLNTSGRPKEGLAVYQQALALVESHPSNRSRHAMVLRGIGFSQTELGDLDAAEQAYRKSLEIDPGNTTATNELEYIRQQREKRAAQP